MASLADAGLDKADGRGGYWDLVAGSLVNLGDGGKAASERGRFQGISGRGQVEGDGFRPGGQHGGAVVEAGECDGFPWHGQCGGEIQRL